MDERRETDRLPTYRLRGVGDGDRVVLPAARRCALHGVLKNDESVAVDETHTHKL